MADFTGDDLTRSRFERVDLSGSEHHPYAERDLAALEARQREDADGRSLPA